MCLILHHRTDVSDLLLCLMLYFLHTYHITPPIISHHTTYHITPPITPHHPPSRVVPRDRVRKIPYGLDVTFTNDDVVPLNWSVDVTSLRSGPLAGVFHVAPSSGLLGPGEFCGGHRGSGGRGGYTLPLC